MLPSRHDKAIATTARVAARPGPALDWASTSQSWMGRRSQVRMRRVIVLSRVPTGEPTRLCGRTLNPETQRRPWLTSRDHETKRHARGRGLTGREARGRVDGAEEEDN